jgi:CheY-like chemotaxis protein
MALQILVVDDEATNREIAALLLRHAGHEVTCCDNGREVLDLLFEEGRRFDALVLDILMPEVDGLEVARQVRRHPATAAIPIVCVSARASGSDAAAGLAAGCDTYVTKPYRRSALLEALDEALALRGQDRPT